MCDIERFDYCFKYILLGDSATGKTSILNRYCNKEHIRDYNSTIGVDFKTMILDNPKYGKKIKFHIWDTAGQEKFLSIVKSYFRGITICVLVFDITNKYSFNNIKNWIDELNYNCSHLALKVLVANKIDLESDEYLRRCINDFEKKNDLFLLYTSAKKNINVEEIFYLSSEKVLEKILNNEIEMKDFKKYSITCEPKHFSHFKIHDNIIKKNKCCSIL